MKAALALGVLLVCFSASACVTSPTDMSQVGSRYDAIDFGGYATKAGARVRIYAWHHDRQEWRSRREVRSGTASIGRETKLYRFDADDVTLPAAYWVPSPGGCKDPGMARLQARELISGTWTPMATFTSAGLGCAWREVANGAEPVDAGEECATGNKIVLFAPIEC